MQHTHTFTCTSRSASEMAAQPWRHSCPTFNPLYPNHLKCTSNSLCTTTSLNSPLTLPPFPPPKGFPPLHAALCPPSHLHLQVCCVEACCQQWVQPPQVGPQVVCAV